MLILKLSVISRAPEAPRAVGRYTTSTELTRRTLDALSSGGVGLRKASRADELVVAGKRAVVSGCALSYCQRESGESAGVLAECSLIARSLRC